MLSLVIVDFEPRLHVLCQRAVAHHEHLGDCDVIEKTHLSLYPCNTMRTKIGKNIGLTNFLPSIKTLILTKICLTYLATALGAASQRERCVEVQSSVLLFDNYI